MAVYATYVVYIDAVEYENGTLKLEDIPGFIEKDYQGTESY